MVNFERKETYSLQDLIEILRILRAPGGCPWDRAQTHLSDRRNFLEEAYEAAEAFDRDDPALMCEELGDMLMQVLFNIHIEEDAGRFTTDDVTDHICKKLIFRHPHVFGTAAADTSEEVLVNWEALKRQEKGQQTTADAMDAVARSLPALWRADKRQSKASKAGFEFADNSGASDKLDEETRELRDEERNRGAAFTRLIKSWEPACPPEWLPLLMRSQLGGMAWLGVRWGISTRELALSLGYSWIESAVMAGVKLVPFGQQAAQQLIIDLSDHFAAGFEQAFLRGDDALGAATPLSAIASARHETQYSRLFRS